MIREVLSRSLFALHEAPWLDLSMGLVNPSVARGKYKDFLDSAMGALFVTWLPESVVSINTMSP